MNSRELDPWTAGGGQPNFADRVFDTTMFSVSCQYAHQDHAEQTDLGQHTDEGVLRAFDEFDWNGQVVEAEQLEKVSPTLSVADGDRSIWVSAYRDGNGLKFVSEFGTRIRKKVLFGLIERENVVGSGTQRFGASEARRAIELFVSKDEAGLQDLYRKFQ